MAVVKSWEDVTERKSTGEIRGQTTYTRSFTVRVDSPNTSLADIRSAPGIWYGDMHPDDQTVYVINIEVSADGDSMMIYKVVFQYGIVEREGVMAQPEEEDKNPAKPPSINKVPLDAWSGSSSLYSEGSATCSNGQYIRNTAGVVLPGVQIEKVEQQLDMKMYFDEQDRIPAMKLGSLLGQINMNPWPLADGSLGRQGEWRFSGMSWSWEQQAAYTTQDGVDLPAKLTYYVLNITLSRKEGMKFDDERMDYQGEEFDYSDYDQWVTPWIPWIVSQGYMEYSKKTPNRVPIMQPIEYKDCQGNDVTPPSGSPNTPCEWPLMEPVSEPQPLNLDGYQCDKYEEAAVVLPNTIRRIFDPNNNSPDPGENPNFGKYSFDFNAIFGNPLDRSIVRIYYPQNTP
jgi:hypothetical protein